ncbi:MAG: phosphatidylglycerophosphatase A [Desulfosarcinaceae bacterium]
MANYRHGAMNLKRHAVMFLATGGYTGRIPFAPGSFGSLVGIPLVYVLAQLPLAMAAITTVLLIAGAIWVAHEGEKALKVHDPGCIVIDEIVGMCVALLGLPFTIPYCVAGYVLFRIFDIVKPPPARQADQKLNGGLGIVMDDVIAGLMTNILIRLLRLFWA